MSNLKFIKTPAHCYLTDLAIYIKTSCCRYLILAIHPDVVMINFSKMQTTFRKSFITFINIIRLKTMQLSTYWQTIPLSLTLSLYTPFLHSAYPRTERRTHFPIQCHCSHSHPNLIHNFNNYQPQR